MQNRAQVLHSRRFPGRTRSKPISGDRLAGKFRQICGFRTLPPAHRTPGAGNCLLFSGFRTPAVPPATPSYRKNHPNSHLLTVMLTLIETIGAGVGLSHKRVPSSLLSSLLPAISPIIAILTRNTRGGYLERVSQCGTPGACTAFLPDSFSDRTLPDTGVAALVAAGSTALHTQFMRPRRSFGAFLLAAAVFGIAALPSFADEIRLKDGKKLYGVIVAYEDNMFKVKTDYGYVLVEKDKIAAIIPTAPASPKPESPKEDSEPAKLPATKSGAAAAKPAVGHPEGSAPAVRTAAEKTAAEKKDNSSPSVAKSGARPEATSTRNVAAESPALKNPEPSAAKTAADSAPPAPSKEPEPPPNREEIRGNTYTNFTHHFRMYKAPSWDLIEDARRALPNAIVAMGTADQSTLLVIGEEKTAEPLDTASTAVENRLRDVYESYRRVSREKTTVAGQPAIEFKYRGMADDHLWWGTLVVVSRGTSTLTILGMTYAETDLIQIQENVIARAISSLDFSVQ